MIAERLGLVGRSTLVLLSVLLLQVSVMADLPLAGAVADLMMLMALAAGSVGGADRGAAFGFAAGVTYDLLLDTPFGLSALTYVLAGYAAGLLAGRVLQPRWWFHVAMAAGLSVAAVLFSVVVARMLGSAYALDDVVRMVVVVALWNAALILPARRMWLWVLGESAPSRFRMALS